MLSLTEDHTKDFLRGRGLPVPGGAAAQSAESAEQTARELGKEGFVVKALVPTGRRGKADAVRLVDDAAAAGKAAGDMLGTQVHGFEVKQVYVEERVDIAQELYLSFILESFPPKALASRRGGVDIEQVHRTDPEVIAQADIDPVRGLRIWEAIDLWQRAGVSGRDLLPLARITTRLWESFVAADAVMMEINPLAIDRDGKLALVGAMLGIDTSALTRHPAWQLLDEGSLISAWRNFNEREKKIAEINRTVKGGAVRYTELDGEIGLLIGGGGAGFLQHDMILAAGGRPANHTDSNPGPGMQQKFKAVLNAILDNPNTRGLLVGYNYQQLSSCDLKVEPIVEVLQERKVDLTRFPVVIRLFGPGEERARSLAAKLPEIHYMPAGSTLDEAVLRIVELTSALPVQEAAR